MIVRKSNIIGRTISLAGAVGSGPYDWRGPNTVLLVQMGDEPEDQNKIRAYATYVGACEHVMSILRVTMNLQDKA